LQGFDAESFDVDFKFYGNRECWDCAVPDAVRLREDIRRIEEAIRKCEEEVKQEEPSWIATRMWEYYKRPIVVRGNKMMYVELKLYEEMGGVKGKSCEVKNKYRCPYAEGSEQLIKDGMLVKALWRLVEWYDDHWNPSQSYRPSATDMKWYHYDEPSIIDVTSYEDVLKAVEDGRLEKIMKERERYEKETKSET